jgi:hypothetical protein
MGVSLLAGMRRRQRSVFQEGLSPPPSRSRVPADGSASLCERPPGSPVAAALHAVQVVEVRDVRIRDCAVRVKEGSSSKQMKGALTSYECWLEFEVQRRG